MNALITDWLSFFFCKNNNKKEKCLLYMNLWKFALHISVHNKLFICINICDLKRKMWNYFLLFSLAHLFNFHCFWFMILEEIFLLTVFCAVHFLFYFLLHPFVISIKIANAIKWASPLLLKWIFFIEITNYCNEKYENVDYCN